MSEMVERIAKAIHEESSDELTACLGLARAAIGAMRDPTNKMICAVLDGHDKNPRRTITEDWQTMIDAALKD